MATASALGLLTGSTAGRVLARRWNRGARRLRSSELGPVLLIWSASLLIGAAQYALPAVPLSTLVLPMVVGNLLLGPRTLPWAVVLALGVLVVVAAATPSVLDGRRIGGVLVTFLVGLVILVSSFRRTELGVAGSRGESMLVDLRDRIHRQATVPALPEDWYVEAVMRSAGGSSFAGDFLVAARSDDGRSVQVAVVDVSGKGEQAGSRALLLSGAFGGLLGALPAAGFLPAANDYLLRQDWDEGFATAAHVSVDLDSGDFQLRSAGHPPATQLRAGSGRWTVHQPEGPVLGLIPGATFAPVQGTLERGDALLLYTDGLVETAERDIAHGLDRLLGQGERILRDGVELAAERLVDTLGSTNDDRALLLLHRRLDGSARAGGSERMTGIEPA